MGNHIQIQTANDNSPAILASQAQQAGSVDAAPLSAPHPKSLITSGPIPLSISSGQSSHAAEYTGSLKLALGCWLSAILLMAATFLLNTGTGPKALASIALLWAGLWTSYICADYGKWRLSEMSVVTALAGLMGAVIVSANYFDLGLTLSDGLMLMSIVPLILAYILKSRISALASICASLIWAAFSFTGFIELSNLIMLLPAIFAAQIFVGTKIRSGMIITLAVLTAYYCIANAVFQHWSAGNLPLTFAAAAMFIIGAAHHRAGKAAEDKDLTGSYVHIYAGWLAALIGAIGFQYYWLAPDALQSETGTLTFFSLNLWKGIVLTALAVIFCSAIIRYKHSQISLIGIFLLTAASALLPLMLWFPTWPDSVAAAIPGVSTVPAIGILIGSAITAAALGMMLNGVRRHSPIMIAMGLCVVLAEAALLLQPDLVTIDYGIIFISGFLASLAVGATIAGSSLSHQAPAPRLQHA